MAKKSKKTEKTFEACEKSGCSQGNHLCCKKGPMPKLPPLSEVHPTFVPVSEIFYKVTEVQKEEVPQAVPAPVVSAVEPAVAPPPEVKPQRLNKSLVAGPTKLVWNVADLMVMKDPKVRRRDIIKACEAGGIAYWTARTQVQSWFAARKADAEAKPASPFVKAS